MPGNVQVGMKYYQEFTPGIAEVRAEIMSVNDVLAVPAGNFTDVLRVEKTNPLEPDVREDNFNAPGDWSNPRRNRKTCKIHVTLA